jgi:MFS family permease
MSEIYGRHVVLTSANAFFCVWLIGCALAPSLGALVAFRFLTGMGGSGCLTIGGGVIADLMPIHRRGMAITVWMIGPLVGPTIGPPVGALIAEHIGWRWANWLVLIPGAIVTAIIGVFNRETNARVLMNRKVKRLRRELCRPELRSCYDPPDAGPENGAKILLNGLVRPLKMLFLSPLIFGVSLYVSFAYGCLYLLFNTIPIVFQQQYHWTLGLAGLSYLGIGVGYGLGAYLFAALSDKTVIRMMKANGGVFEPEMRLPYCIYFAFLLPVTFFWYGWSAHYVTHWIVPIVGLVPFGVAILGIWNPIQAYIIDAYPEFSASGLAAFTVFRSVVAAFLPLAGPRMYSALGLGWGNSVLGFIAAALIPVPFLVYRFGGRIRRWQDFEL